VLSGEEDLIHLNRTGARLMVKTIADTYDEPCVYGRDLDVI
jgi:hypothetical protein